nr:unnamed protein product [Callosobruchus analis]
MASYQLLSEKHTGSSVYTNLVIYRTCYVVLGYNQSECAMLGNVDNNVTEHLEKLVEPEANIINMVKNTVGSIFSVILCIFIGPWSDRMVVFEAVLTVGTLIGSMTSSYIFYMTSYQAIFGIAAVCHIIALLYTWGMVPESVTNVETENNIREFFILDNVQDMIKVALKKREHYKRAIILLCVGILTIYIFIINGNTLTFQYLREKFGWTLTRYTIFSSVDSVVWTIGSFLTTYILHNVLKVTESVLVLVGCISMMNASLLLAMARSNARLA